MTNIIDFKSRKKEKETNDTRMEELSKLTWIIADKINSCRDQREANETILLLQAFLFRLSKDNEDLKDQMYLIIQNFIESDK